MKKLTSLILTLLLFCIFCFAQNVFAQSGRKITDRLLALAQEKQRASLARQADGGGEDSKVRVLFYPVGKKSSNIDLSFFKRNNIEYIKSKSYLTANIDASLIYELENIAGVEKIDISFPPKPLFIGQGVGAINAADYYGGDGVKIAVIDVKEPGGGFKGYKDLQRRGELPKSVITKDFTRRGAPPIEDEYELGEHGNACAEIIYDIVPKATMYLLEIKCVASFQNAYKYCRDEEIKIASVSLGWSFGTLTDVGYGVSEVAQIVENTTGTLSVVAAGNDGYYQSPNINSPGDARSALTVGAISWSNYARGQIEPFSSVGPVKEYNGYIDGEYVSLSSATKPEITAPDGVNSVAYGDSFYGTSAATPHVAGVAALLLGWSKSKEFQNLFPNLSAPASLKAEVIKYAKPVAGQTLPNNIYGYGRLILDNNLVKIINTGNIIVYPNPVSISKKGSVKITNIPINTRIYGVNIFTVTGQFVKSLDFTNSMQ
ncbi:MAG: S8 family serine peptidase, partial [Endomicrobium sp.]|nr:S8 family serine peptidase [Endomicrobium sp.]